MMIHDALGRVFQFLKELWNCTMIQSAFLFCSEWKKRTLQIRSEKRRLCLRIEQNE